MATGSRYFSVHALSEAATEKIGASNRSRLAQVGLVFCLIMIAVWTAQGQVNSSVSLAAMFCVLGFTLLSGYSAGELGLSQPSSGIPRILLTGALLVLLIAAAGLTLTSFGPPHPVPWNRAWQYAIWALAQEFILQSFFYIRLESVFGSSRAIWASALLFSIAHIPSPVLTGLSFIGGILFCLLFRRYRNLYPVGLVHAAIGLTIAASLPDSLLHHMRVGIGFLQYHS